LAVGGGVLNYISGYHRPFTLTEYDISYPNTSGIISVPVLIAIALVAPAVIILFLSLILASKNPALSRPTKWRGAYWNVHVGWLGLALALATTLFITSGLKDLIGKPRPDLLARCHPDLSAVAQYLVGGFGSTLDSEAEPLVSDGICQQTDKRFLDDGFAAFPSGHSSFSSAGLVYLSLWLSARLSVRIPCLDHTKLPLQAKSKDKIRHALSASDSQSAPPLWQAAIALCPLPVAIFVCASRYADFHHAGVDIFAGAVLGTVIGWATFRLYHLPIRRGTGALTWGPRPRRHPFFAIALHEDQDGDGERPDLYHEGQHTYGYPLDNLEAHQSGATVRRSGTENSTDPIFQPREAYQQDSRLT
jgi:membrane-associated phospholipid phosphatase